jgi:hypothetical protein
MTITSTTNRVSIGGDGTTTTFSFPHRFLQPADLVVILRSAAGVDTVQTLSTHYRVTGEGDATGGSVIFDIIEDGEPIVGETVVIYNDPGITQGTDYIAGGTFSAESHETALDLLTLQQQRTRNMADRTPRLADGDPDGSGGYGASGYQITNLALTPTATSDATSKNYVDSEITARILAGAGAITTSDSYVTATGSTTARKLGDRWGEVFNVKDYGAIGNGSANDTVAIDAAWAAARERVAEALTDEAALMEVFGATLYFPAGDYVYLGTGLTATGTVGFNIIGDSRSSTRIRISDTAYFINLDNYVDHMRIADLHFEGGLGTFRNLRTGVNVAAHHIVERCLFSNYSECAIGHNASDMPYWRITDNVFYGVPTLTSIGVALSGLTNNSTVENNSFLNNRYNLKLDQSGVDVMVQANDFVHFVQGGSPLPDIVDIWIVPRDTSPHHAAYILNNKFGSENAQTTDQKILIADEGAGTYFTDKVHATTLSTGVVNGLHVRDNQFAGASGYAKPYIYSYTANIHNIHYSNFQLGSRATGILEFDSTVAATRDRHDQSYIEFLHADQAPNVLHPPVSVGNVLSWGLVNDPYGLHAGEPSVPHYFSGAGDDASFVNLLTGNDVTSDGSVTNAARANVTDALGGTNAVEVNLSTSGGVLGLPLVYGSFVAGQLTFVEIDVLLSSTHPLVSIRLELWDGGGLTFRRIVRLPAAWKTVRFSFVPKTSFTSGANIRIYGGDATSSDYSEGATDRFKVGRPHVYHAYEPVNMARLSAGTTQSTVGSAGSASAVPSAPTGYTSILIEGTEYVIPYYAKS